MKERRKCEVRYASRRRHVKDGSTFAKSNALILGGCSEKMWWSRSSNRDGRDSGYSFFSSTIQVRERRPIHKVAVLRPTVRDE